MPCTQLRYGSQRVALQSVAAATPQKRPAGLESSPGREGSGSGLSAGGYAAGGLHGPSRTQGNQGVEVPAKIWARAKLRRRRSGTKDRSDDSQRLVMRRVHDIGPFPHQREPRQLDLHKAQRHDRGDERGAERPGLEATRRRSKRAHNPDKPVGEPAEFGDVSENGK